VSRPALRRCVAGDLAEFAADVWSSRPLLSGSAELAAHQPADGFADLFSLASVDELLSRRGLRTPFIRMAKGGAVVPPARYTRSGGTGALIADQVADDRVMELFADGHTMVLQGLHRTWAPLADFAGQLATDLGHPVQVNAYITPTQSQGFSAHYDVHDVFVLQVAGEKRWLVHEPVLRDPLRSEPWEERRDAVSARAAEQPVIDTVLRPGDALYLPRGYLHSAEALGDVSCHLTVGVHPVTRQAVLDELVALVRDDPSLRTSLPLGTDVGDAEAVADDVRATVDAVVARLSEVPPSEVAGRLAARLLDSNRPAAVPPLATLAALQRMGAETRVAGRAHLRAVVEDGPGGAVVRLAGRSVELPAGAVAAVRLLLAGETFPAGALPGLSPEGSLELARRLVREAVAVIPRSDGPA
jgi:bifunctional lysine-specific demethylase and histidyl-hydroxylase NO66